jgi:hypothetical protein
MTYSDNATATSNNTTFKAVEPGEYGLWAAIIDAAGLEQDSGVVEIDVPEVLTRVVVMPGTTSVASGDTQQFAAVGYDQFGYVMASQPITWTVAGAGSIDSQGLFTAPGSLGSTTIIARIGSVLGTADIDILPAVDGLQLQDADLAATVGRLDADGSINRQDMIDILRSVASSHATLTSAELLDLQAIVADAAALNMPGYVQVLASDVVNGSPANALYQGQPLGNLAPGSGSAQLNNLINKWFLGTDHPGTAAYDYTIGALVPGGVIYYYSFDYAQAGGKLFIDGPSPTDAAQGWLGDCYFITALGSIAHSNPDAIRDMIIDNGDGTYTVRFYTGVENWTNLDDGTVLEGFGTAAKADYVTVDSMLPVFPDGTTLVYDGTGQNVTSPTTELWLPLLEKAYVQWNETGRLWRPGFAVNGIPYYNTVWGGYMGDVYAQVLGHSGLTYYPANGDKQAMIDAVTSNKAVSVATNNDPGNGLVGAHAYAVLGYDSASDTFTLYNPWGWLQPDPLTWEQLTESCYMWQTSDAADATPLNTTTPVSHNDLILGATAAQPRLTLIDAMFAAWKETGIAGDARDSAVVSSTEFTPTKATAAAVDNRLLPPGVAIPACPAPLAESALADEWSINPWSLNFDPGNTALRWNTGTRAHTVDLWLNAESIGAVDALFAEVGPMQPPLD